MTSRPSDEISAAVLDTFLSLELSEEDGGADRGQLEAAVAQGVAPNVALDRYLRDHPGGPMSPGEKTNAIDDGKILLAAEAITWLLEQGHLAATDAGRIRIGGKPLKTHPFGRSDQKPEQYIPGTDYENNLFHADLRRVAPARVKLIRDSMTALGDLREFFPVLVDERGEVVDGRHRLAIDPDWPVDHRRIVPVSKRFTVATAANRVNAWTVEDWKRLRELAEDQHGRQAASRKLAEIALLENHERSDRTIAKLTGASHPTVSSVRSQLVATGKIYQWSHSSSKKSPKATTAHDQAAPAPARPPTVEELVRPVTERIQQGLNQSEIGRELGLRHDSMPLSKAYGIAQERITTAQAQEAATLAAEQERQAASRAAEKNRQRNQQILDEWAGRTGSFVESFENAFVQSFHEAPTPVQISALDEIVAQARDLRQRLQQLNGAESA